MANFELKNKNDDTNYQYQWNKNFEDSLKTLMLYSWWILWWFLTVFISNYEKFQLIKFNNYILIMVVIFFLASFIFSLLWKVLLTFLAYSLYDFWNIRDNLDWIKNYIQYVEKQRKTKNNLEKIKNKILSIKNMIKNFERKIKKWNNLKSLVSLCFVVSLIGFIIWIFGLTYLFFEIIK